RGAMAARALHRDGSPGRAGAKGAQRRLLAIESRIRRAADRGGVAARSAGEYRLHRDGDRWPVEDVAPRARQRHRARSANPRAHRAKLAPPEGAPRGRGTKLRVLKGERAGIGRPAPIPAARLASDYPDRVVRSD